MGQVDEKDISAGLYVPEVQPLRVLAKGERVELSLTFNKIRLFKLIGGTGAGTFTEWVFLYREGQDTVSAATGGRTPVACSAPDSESMILVKK